MNVVERVNNIDEGNTFRNLSSSSGLGFELDPEIRGGTDFQGPQGKTLSSPYVCWPGSLAVEYGVLLRDSGSRCAFDLENLVSFVRELYCTNLGVTVPRHYRYRRGW